MISSDPVSDAVLLRRFAVEDDGTAFEELVRRHSGMTRGVCRRVLGPAGDADDAAQIAFLSLATNARTLADRVGPHGSLAGWIYRVAVNASLQQRRAARARQRREAAVVRERHTELDSVAVGIEHSELLAVLDEELKELPPRYRTPLVLCHLEGKTQHEAAEQLGLSFGTLRRRLDRGRKMLRVQIGRRGVVATPALLALIWKSAAAEAAIVSTTFLDRVTTAMHGGSSPVAVVRPRLSSSARVPRPTPPVPHSASAATYSYLLAAVLVAMMLPPVLSLTVSSSAVASSEPETTQENESTGPSSQFQSGSTGRSL